MYVYLSIYLSIYTNTHTNTHPPPPPLSHTHKYLRARSGPHNRAPIYSTSRRTHIQNSYMYSSMRTHNIDIRVLTTEHLSGCCLCMCLHTTTRAAVYVWVFTLLHIYIYIYIYEFYTCPHSTTMYRSSGCRLYIYPNTTTYVYEF
jgi:hypothetical protein